MHNAPSHNWRTAWQSFRHPKVVILFLLGFSAGIPLLLIFSSLSLWLREAGVERATVTNFSWAALGYSFKFVWAPLVDQLPIPWLTRFLGRRRAWMLVAQILVMVAIFCMALIDPQAGENQLKLMALAAVLLGFSSATQDIVIDAYRIESANEDLQAMLSASYIVGYRVAMLLAGAGSLYLATWFGSSTEQYLYHAWFLTYCVMALAMMVGVVTTLSIAEPDTPAVSWDYNVQEYLRFVLLFIIAVSGFVACFYFTANVAATLKTYLPAFLVEFVRLVAAVLVAALIAVVSINAGLSRRDMVFQTYVMPVSDFFSRYGWSLAWLLLALIGLYRISDIVLGVISNVFYQDMGYSKNEIASAVKTFGLLMTIVGGFIGGAFAIRYGVMRILLLGGVLAAATNLLFMLLATIGYDLTWLYIVVGADNLAAGLASAAFVAFLSSLTNISFTAMQYAIFSSLMTLIPKILGGYSGGMVNAMGYTNFFLMTALMGIPVLLLIVFCGHRFKRE